jgi:enterochelin esterase-like enzyme
MHLEMARVGNLPGVTKSSWEGTSLPSSFSRIIYHSTSSTWWPHGKGSGASCYTIFVRVTLQEENKQKRMDVMLQKTAKASSFGGQHEINCKQA